MENVSREASPETYDALQEALAAHVAKIYPEYPLLTDYAIVAASVGQSMEYTGYTYVKSQTPYHSLEGLVTMLGRNLEDQFYSSEDDDA